MTPQTALPALLIINQFDASFVSYIYNNYLRINRGLYFISNGLSPFW